MKVYKGSDGTSLTRMTDRNHPYFHYLCDAKGWPYYGAGDSFHRIKNARKFTSTPAKTPANNGELRNRIRKVIVALEGLAAAI